MAPKLQEKCNKSEFSEGTKIDTEEANKSERLNAISKKKEERLLVVKRDLEEKLRKRLIVKNSDLKMETTEQEKKFTNEKKSFYEKQMTQIRSEMKELIEAGVLIVKASEVIPSKVKFDGKDKLTIGKMKYKIKNNVHMVGWGKETAVLGASFEKLIGDQMKNGFLVVPRKIISSMAMDYQAYLPKHDTVITYFEVDADEEPTAETLEANKKIFEYCKKLKKSDILVVILSPGTDNLLCLPKGNIGVKEKLRFLREMKNANATKEEINIMRKKLSQIRGSGLARAAFPAKVITIIMSDVPGDNINEIAGAPTVNESWTDEVNAILHKYHLPTNLSLSMRQVLGEVSPSAPKKMVSASGKFKFVDYHIIASNADAADGMAKAAFKLGYIPVKVSSSCVGSSRTMGREYVKFASLMILAVEGKISKLEFYRSMMQSRILPLTENKVREIFPSKEKWGLGLYLLLGGRGSVDVADPLGQGGPNQELALYFSMYWYLRCRQYPILNEYVVWFLGGASSGKDGNSPVSGAFGYSALASGVWEKFQELSDLYIETKLTMMDLDTESKENEEFMQLVDILRKEISRVKNILPDEILSKNNTNFFFNNINGGEELLEIGDKTDYTFTNVGDFHLIRIVRFQCNCDGSCSHKKTQSGGNCPKNECSNLKGGPEGKFSMLRENWCTQGIQSLFKTSKM